MVRALPGGGARGRGDRGLFDALRVRDAPDSGVRARCVGRGHAWGRPARPGRVSGWPYAASKGLGTREPTTCMGDPARSVPMDDCRNAGSDGWPTALLAGCRAAVSNADPASTAVVGLCRSARSPLHAAEVTRTDVGARGRAAGRASVQRQQGCWHFARCLRSLESMRPQPACFIGLHRQREGSS